MAPLSEVPAEATLITVAQILSFAAFSQISLANTS